MGRARPKARSEHPFEPAASERDKHEPGAFGIAAARRAAGFGVGHTFRSDRRTGRFYRRSPWPDPLCFTRCRTGPVRDCDLDRADTTDYDGPADRLRQADCRDPEAVGSASDAAYPVDPVDL